ncbi:hypothetical protein [Novosphingobium ginsenosidimutans]|uniref:Uncharacterized protein n=1 Tax=Novosphingobium ginsenosidimutans TaxID=1176536 RepID=A0A5B8S4F5_9SPHN|nr:hypothetical protein [Novosphingobium ginsenosidimutans]QEA16446.1 hypothetical protein FRF71_10055 [Novosphingobium ginsenosidimutans]
MLSLFGCKDPYGPFITTSGNLTQEQVDAIVEECGGNMGMAVVENGSLTINQASDVEVTACVLKALQATGQTTLSSVRNQMYEMPKPER